jgi:hypothetical protein
MGNHCCTGAREEPEFAKDPDGQRRDTTDEVAKIKKVLVYFKKFEDSLKL